MSDNKEYNALTRRAALIMTANLIATGIVMVLPFVLVRTLNQFEFGLYKQSFQIVATAQSMLNLQVSVSVFYFIAREPTKKLQVVNNLIWFYGTVGLSVFGLFSFWPGWVNLIFHNADLLVHYVPAIGLMIFVSLVSTNLGNVPIALGDVRTASLLIVGDQLTKAICMIIAALVFGSLMAILTAAIVHSLLYIVYISIYLRRKFGRTIMPLDAKLFRAQIGNSVPFGLGSITAIIQFDLHNYFVSHYYDSAQYAIYATGCFQLPLLGMLQASFTGALNPELAKHKESGNYKAIIDLWMDVARKLAFFFFPTVAVMFILRNDLIVFLFTSAYKSSASIFAINLIGLLLNIAVHIHIQRLFDELKYMRFKMYLVLIPITFFSLYTGYRYAGLVGIAFAFVFIQIIDFVIQIYMISKQLPMDKQAFYKLRVFIPISGATIAAALITVILKITLLHFTVLNSFGVLVIFGSIFAMIYILGLILSGAITEREQLDIRDFIARQLRRVVPETL